MEENLTFDHSWKGETAALAVKRAVRGGNAVPGFVWLGGFRSDMTGTKAQTMVAEAEVLGASSLRFDYSGHGVSGGEFTSGTISRWVDESLHVVRNLTDGPQVLVGSSMGGWIALRLAQELSKGGEADRLAGLLLIAPAPDFTKELMEPSFSQDQWRMLEKDGRIEEPSAYSDEPTIITRDLIEDGRNNLVLNCDLLVRRPIRILQGMKDPDVPHTHALRLLDHLVNDTATLTLVKGGDHRLSEPSDLNLLRRTMGAFVPDDANEAAGT